MTNPFLVIPQMSSPSSLRMSSNRTSSGMTQLDFSSSPLKRGSSEMTVMSHNYGVARRRISFDFGNPLTQHGSFKFFIVSPSYNFIK